MRHTFLVVTVKNGKNRRTFTEVIAKLKHGSHFFGSPCIFNPCSISIKTGKQNILLSPLFVPVSNGFSHTSLYNVVFSNANRIKAYSKH